MKIIKRKTKCHDKDHPDHKKEMARLKRIEGQIKGVQKMIEEQRYCVDILQQLSAIKSAVISVQANLLETHLKECVSNTLKAKKPDDIEKKLEELKNIFKKC